MYGLLAEQYGLKTIGSVVCGSMSETRGETGLPLARACAALGLTRSEVYRWSGNAADEAEMKLRHAIQEIALEMPSYGYRRVHRTLLRQGWMVNDKPVRRLMRQDNLLCLRRRKFVVHTTDSNHGLPIYPNLVPNLEVTGINQLWVADITYVRLWREFVFLAVLLDVYSRRCIGWAMAHHLRAELPLAALQMALRERLAGSDPHHLVHHSDRGTQYASDLYTGLLTQHGISISMSRAGNPYDNAFAESFIKTLKYEEVNLYDYEVMDDAVAGIGHFIEQVYNAKRLHSSLGYLTPIEFELTKDSVLTMRRDAVHFASPRTEGRATVGPDPSADPGCSIPRTGRADALPSQLLGQNP